MSGTDLVQSRRYLELLRGNSDSIVTWQLFTDNKDAERGLGQVFHNTLDNCLSTLKSFQDKGYGVYVTINPTDNKGRDIGNITSYDWVFADIDGVKIPSDFPLKPAFISGRDDSHGHVYWPIEGCLSVKQYNYVQRLISLYLDSDEQVIDPSRVARVPGFKHLKNPTDPKYYKIFVDNSNEVDFNYHITEVIEAFKLPNDKQVKLDNWIKNREALETGSGFNDDPIYRKQLINWVANQAPIAIEGSGSYTLIKVALYGFDRGIPEDETVDILWEHYNPRCSPPWSEKEYKNFKDYVSRAYKYCNNAPGCRTATGSFSGMQVPEPPDGWEANKALQIDAKVDNTPTLEHIDVQGDIAFITPDQAAINKAMITNKSSVFDLGLKFIGELYPYKTILRYDRIFYNYNGTHWQELPEEYLKHQISYSMAGWKFPPSKINNIVDMLQMHVYEHDLQKGTYLNDRNKDGKNSIIMKNGIVEIEDGKVELKPHTRNLFDMNALDYDYDPDATCDEFLNFIESQWPGDKDMHDQMQELYGLSLVYVHEEHSLLPVMTGKSRSGKGLHARLLTALVGAHNVCNPNLESLIEDYTINTMSTRKLAIIPEANALHHNIKDRVLNRLKSITGGDGIQYDRKYKDAAECRVWPMTIIQSNEMPDFSDPSGALSYRIWAFPFVKSYAGMEDKTLEARLTTPESISGIFNWALKGLVRVLRTGNVTRAKQSMEFVEDIRYDSFPLANFLEEFCVIDPLSTVYVDDLYDMYLIHSKLKNIKLPLTQIKFGKMLNSSYHNITKTRETKNKDGGVRKYVFTGVKLNDFVKEKWKTKSTKFTSVETDVPRMPPTSIK